MTKKRKEYDLFEEPPLTLSQIKRADKAVSDMFKAHKARKSPHGTTFTNLGLKRKKR